MNHFPRTLFDRLQQDVPSSELLLECLLWRGFLAYRSDDSLFLSAGSTANDIKVLKRLGLNLIPRPDAPGCPLLIEPVPTEDVAKISRHIFSIEGVNGMTFNDLHKDDFLTWKKGVFGAKVDVAHLDPGVALLVKVLPLCGVLTSMSCDGHATQAPMIWFHSRWDMLWCKAIVRRLSPQDEFCEMNFIEEPKSGNFRYKWTLRNEGCGEELAAQSRLYHSIQRLARAILEAAREGNIRQAKQNLLAEADDFSDSPFSSTG